MKPIFEFCPHCQQDVELKEEFKVQVCPNCGKPILPCAMCDNDKVKCSECPLKY